MLVADLLEDWFAAKRNWRASTRKGHRENLDLHILPVVGHRVAAELTVREIGAVFSRIDERNAAIAAGAPGRPIGLQTQRNVYATLRGGLNWAVRTGRLPSNPALGLQLEPVRRRDVAVWDADQIRAFLAFTSEDRLAALWRVILLRGLRRGEALGLRWDRVDLDGPHPRLRITDTLLSIGGQIVAGTPKTRAGQRFVSLDPGTVAVLRAHRERQEAERSGPDWNEAGLVFTRPDGHPLHPDHTTILFKRLTKEAGLPVIRLHDGRHSAASLGLAAGVDIKVVSDMLGHSTTAITQDLYTHVIPALADETAARMAALVDRPASGMHDDV